MAQAVHVTSAIGALTIGASTKPSTSPVRAAHAELVPALAGHPPRAIPVDADTTDLEDRADHLKKVLNALWAYLSAILKDTAQNVPGGLDLCQVVAVLSDLTSDVAGSLQHAAESMARRVV
jgi:hypothetical protein